ncbi:unnamed protein product [Spirodela intermedia]|uniref:Tyrosinase copper-binding domain-containing protein n=1 Tax=Spirodela intermedia TaxID=51605 RepID=A0A7I8ITR4_SPIIN|nr:unnamed protein product [Spirodela intermedia]CAA6661364.1 unnamed protein product [Spirodela intermedia]
MGQRVHLVAAALLLAILITANWFSGDLRDLIGYCPRIGYLLQTVNGVGRGPSVAGDNHDNRPLAANLSACHASLTDADRPTYCCPPRRDADQIVVEFQLPEIAPSPLRVRRPAHLLDSDYVAKYEKAVAIMKSLPSDHPHSFLRQANNHCLYCTGSYNQVNSTSLFKIHRSWFFFPWHRAFLYFHERILGSSSATTHLLYRIGFYTRGAFNSTQREPGHLPPHVADLNYQREETGRKPEEQMAVNLAFMYHQMVSGARKAELFMGCKLTAGAEGGCDGPGTIEDAPHNTVHEWVGNGLNPEREYMGAFYTAARDPAFYAHHANIDRLWTVWRKIMDSAAPDFTESSWLDTSFTFYDENLRFVRIKVRDCLDPAKLGYAYENIDLPWLNARPKPAVPPEVARNILKKKDEWSTLLASGNPDGQTTYFNNEEQALGATVRARVQRPRRHGAQAEKGEEEEILVVYGIHVLGDVYAKFDVFVNLVADEKKAGPLAREFAGTFVNTPRGARRVGEDRLSAAWRKSTLKLGISELLEDLKADRDENVWVSLVPRAGSGANIMVDGIRIELLR